MTLSDASLTIALDAMGGDDAPYSVIAGAALTHKQYPNVNFLMFGDEAQLQPIFKKFPELANCTTIHHTDEVIANDDKPSVALRKGKNASMSLAIKAVKEGNADGVISAGNTGALMAISKLALRTLPGVDRPAICAVFPTRVGKCVILDLGANAECSADHLYQFSVMGDAFARAVLGVENPSIGILNIGSEDVKGNESVKLAGQMLRENDTALNFHGFIEGDDIAEGTVDVVVTDGFSGNIALKTAEGTARIISEFLRQALTSSLLAKLGALLAKPALKRMFYRIDPRQRNGAMFLGLNGIAVKSHGGADKIAFANAIDITIKIAARKVNDRIISEIEDSQALVTSDDGTKESA